MVRFIITFILFALSTMGYCEFFREKLKINIYFLPAFTIAFQGSLLFVAGLLNILLETGIIIYLLGFYFLITSILKKRLSFFKPYLNLGYLTLVIGFVLIGIALRHSEFEHYDNFSHWALVIKGMFQTNRFPNFSDFLIEFQSYPLGSASYIWFFCTLTGKAETFQMFAQSFMMLCMMLPWFNYLRKNKIAGMVITILVANFILCYDVKIHELLVDVLLSLVGMAAVLFIYEEVVKNRSSLGNIRFLYPIPLLIWTTQVKNSGLLFAVIAVTLLFTAEKKNKSALPYKLIAFSAPFLSYYLWSSHCKYVFSQATTTYHAMTVKNYLLGFSNKNGTEIINIVEHTIKDSFYRRSLLLFLLFFAAIGLFTYLFNKKRMKDFAKLSAFCSIMYVVYVVGLVGLYVFSMTSTEASTLAGFERYIRTIEMSIMYLALCYILILISEFESKTMIVITSSILITSLLGMYYYAFNYGFYYKRFYNIFYQYSTQRRYEFENIMDYYSLPSESSYLICTSYDNSKFYFYLCKYLLDSNEGHELVVTNERELNELAREHDYLIILDTENEIIQNWVKEKYPDQFGKQVIDLVPINPALPIDQTTNN